MIKPSDIPASFSQTDNDQRSEIEQYIDENLKRATFWPCVVGSTRSGWSRAAVDDVLVSYRAAGWIVTVDRMSSDLATFDHPLRCR